MSTATKVFTHFVLAVISGTIIVVGLISADKTARDQTITRGEVMDMMAYSGPNGFSRNEIDLHEEFFAAPTTSSSPFVLANAGVGGSSPSLGSGFSGAEIGVLSMGVGTSTTGSSSIITGASAIAYYDGVLTYEVAIDTMTRYANATDPCTIGFGFFDTNGGVNQVDGAYFLYDSTGVTTGSAASGKWQCVTASANSRSFYTTTKDVGRDRQVLRIIMMPKVSSGDSVIFMVNNEVLRSQETNIPKGQARSFGAGMFMRKGGAGSSDIRVGIDYIAIRHRPKNPR